MGHSCVALLCGNALFIVYAIRYNKEKGSIVISDQYIPGQNYKLFVKDTGLGIREEEIASIFNRFKKSLHAASEGYGLGLSIVKSIALFHGFEIILHSDLRIGTVFCISIPIEMVEK